MMYDYWVMIVSNGLFVHLSKAKKAISPSHKPSITNGLSCFFSLLGIEEWRGEKELLEKKERKAERKENRAGCSQHPGWVTWVPYSVPCFFCFSGWCSFSSRFISASPLVPSLVPWQSTCLIHVSHPRQSYTSFSLLALTHVPGHR